MPKLTLVSANKYDMPYPVYPLGLSCLETYIQDRSPEYNIQLFDFMLGSKDDFVRHLKQYKPDYVGISLRNIDDINIYRRESFISQYGTIIETAKKFSRGKVIIGGPAYSILPRFLFDHLKPDFAICGEGEESLWKLLTTLENKTDYTTIDGLAYYDNNSKTTRINNKKCYCIDSNVRFDAQLLEYYWNRGGMIPFQTKRGCPYHCIYCTYPLIEGNAVRTHDPGIIADTLADLYFKQKINYVFLADSVFNICNEYNLELAERIIRKKIDIKWCGYFNSVNIDEKLLRVLRRAGLIHIEFGTDSLSDIVLKSYGKPFTVADVLEASAICNLLNINFAHFLILGGYGENEDTLNETFENSKKIKRTVFFPFVGMRIYPGTRLHSIALQENNTINGITFSEPQYYLSKEIDPVLLKKKAIGTGKQWIFQDDIMQEYAKMFRLKGKKGPLWEYLIR